MGDVGRGRTKRCMVDKVCENLCQTWRRPWWSDDGCRAVWVGTVAEGDVDVVVVSLSFRQGLRWKVEAELSAPKIGCGHVLDVIVLLVGRVQGENKWCNESIENSVRK